MPTLLLYRLAATWTAIGLAGGLFYREITRSAEFVAPTQLSVIHTHSLALGTLVMLVLLALERLFAVSRERFFTAGVWVYTAGLALTVTMLAVNGYRTVMGHETPAALAGISGLGHITLTVGFLLLFLALGAAVRREEPAAAVESEYASRA